ncbi:hypothetical protein AGABI2DRAFT_189104 [Agaricus bisporus var. bisporus H97]|uniref:hypothetical protein n=1 Tax=Agaricus bisporus var. bisporus (strain H97 / ATCC MYA-4626 / FGSC 10389) TaxID=936046 RepID=UPI00029F6999|nr:hypothetical protein AGABI2DRAFT_189104 [Agaricus bisporus var. bisporus H97]EKV41656.1 hypothetical protein AGABI2DRAFT_189104 [Agaricus bisporus var. bisporus H97]
MLRPATRASERSSVGYARVSMGPTLEVCQAIVSKVGSRSDLASLCRVSKGFHTFAERGLYNTLHMGDIQGTLQLCKSLANNHRIALLVYALTLYAAVTEEESEESSDFEGEEESCHELPDEYWSSVAGALAQATNLRYLNMHITSNTSANVAWTLDNCTFQLQGFHCDLSWNDHLVSFLNRQRKLSDLYLLDYSDVGDPLAPTSSPSTTATTQALSTSSLSLDPTAFPHLSILECTFSEAALAMIPQRPVTRLKTCFSRTRLEEKKEEATILLSKVRQSTRYIRSLDIGDSEYTTAFSMELLSLITSSPATSSELRYLGTLFLPISGTQRLQFYGLLMRLPRIRCVEVEISDWTPPPSSPPAFRALASEMRLYTPSVTRIVFVQNFERTIVTVVDGVCKMDRDTNYKALWRET